MARQGKRVHFVVETADLGTLRRFEMAESARIRLYFPRPPFGKLEERYVTRQRFISLFAGHDKKQPQPTKLTTRFLMTVRNSKIAALRQLL
jgi:hypothetical protein